VQHIDSLVALIGSQPFLQLVQEKFATAANLHNLLSVQCRDDDDDDGLGLLVQSLKNCAM
jgi:hypothetical protein